MFIFRAAALFREFHEFWHVSVFLLVFTLSLTVRVSVWNLLNNPLFVFVCVAAAGRPSWPRCHCVPCQSAVDPEGQEVPTECRGQNTKHCDYDMNLCWNEIKRKSHNIRYRSFTVTPLITCIN